MDGDNVVRIGEVDEITGFPRRKAFLRTLDARMAELGPGRLERLWVGVLDLPVLRYVRSSMGWEVGDRYLREVASTLRERVPGALVFGRLDGPELAVAAVSPPGDPIREAFPAPAFLGRTFHVDDVPLFMSLRAGIAWREPGDDARALLRKASVALNRAGVGGRGDLVVHDEAMAREAREGAAIARALPRAMEDDALELHYQPKLELETGRMTGVEALLRWPRRGGVPVTPKRIVEIAELTEMIVPLGRWVLRRAALQAAGWRRLGLSPFRIAVNVSAVQLIKSDLVGEVEAALEAAGVGPEWFELELTESAMMAHGPTISALFTRLDRLGIPVAIDDFGTGYSSLAYMKRYPIARLKIDRSFVDGFLENPADAGIVRCVIAIGKNLGFRVVAEGVETAEQAEALREELCDEVQGFFFSRPLLPSDVPAYVARVGLAAGQPR